MRCPNCCPAQIFSSVLWKSQYIRLCKGLWLHAIYLDFNLSPDSFNWPVFWPNSMSNNQSWRHLIRSDKTRSLRLWFWVNAWTTSKWCRLERVSEGKRSTVHTINKPLTPSYDWTPDWTTKQSHQIRQNKVFTSMILSERLNYKRVKLAWASERRQTIYCTHYK